MSQTEACKRTNKVNTVAISCQSAAYVARPHAAERATGVCHAHLSAPAEKGEKGRARARGMEAVDQRLICDNMLESTDLIWDTSGRRTSGALGSVVGGEDGWLWD